MEQNRFVPLVVSLVFVLWTEGVLAQSDPSGVLLPSPEQSKFLSSLEPAARETGSLIELKVRRLDLPNDSYFHSFDLDAAVNQPWQAQRELVILLNPNLSPEALAQAIEEYRFKVIGTMPAIGAITVDASAFIAETGTEDIGVTLDTLGTAAIDEAARRLSQDERFIQVTPNTIVSPFVLASVASPETIAEQAGEVVDWGIVDIGIDQFWPKLDSEIHLGVIDVGFAPHEDLAPENAFGKPLPKNDHGNHVSGIMCAKHNGVGTKGAIPKCKLVVSAGSFFLGDVNPVEGDDLISFYARFGDLVAATLDFMEKRGDVSTINLSLGYNWMPNFGINPEAPGNEEIRDLVRAQGRFFASILAYAKSRNIAIVSAAGNDSRQLTPPMSAEWASAFNAGARMIESLDGWTNGLIVEAHDKDGVRAAFSNINGHISCPGVDVLSALATSASAYGTSSGTSMASPYCAAALAAIRSLRPHLSLKQSIECFLSSERLLENRVPMADLRLSLVHCP